jgi:hypothetical protein
VLGDAKGPVEERLFGFLKESEPVSPHGRPRQCAGIQLLDVAERPQQQVAPALAEDHWAHNYEVESYFLVQLDKRHVFEMDSVLGKSKSFML